MKTTIVALVAAILVLGGAWFLYRSHRSDMSNTTGDNPPAATTTATSTGPVRTMPIVGGTETTDIRISSPLINQTVTSPLTLSGSAKGSWFFEASAPVLLKDASGKTIAQGHITAQGDWMTTNFVAFTGTLTWTATGTSTAASVVFMNDNPSGNPALQKSVTVPVTLSRAAGPVGTLEGAVTLGPTCPVERVPPDPQCAPKGYATKVSASNSSGVVATTQSDASGRYRLTLPAPVSNRYSLTAEGGATLPRCETKTVSVTAGVVTTADLSCDTGIR